MPQPIPHRVLIAGGGVSGLEAVIALHALAGDRVDVTVIAPDEDFVIRALSVREPFARPASRHHRVADICAAHGAAYRRDALQAVHPESTTVTTESGDELTYDSLLVALGARAFPAFDRVTTFRDQHDSEAMHGIIQDVERGDISAIAFVVPTGVTWPLPLYELALMTAERAWSLCLDVAVTIVTPEERPLGIFGRHASEAVDRTLKQAGITIVTSTHVRDVDRGKVLDISSAVVTEAQRVIALPRLAAPRLTGIPADAEGFVRVDEHGRVPGVAGVFAAGDGTSFPIKQGGIAAQQADAAARVIAGRAGASVAPEPFRPTLRAQLLTGTRSLYLREAVAGGAGDPSSVASDHSLWWPPSKVAAPYLAPYLEQLDRGDTTAAAVGSTPHATRIHAAGDPAGGIDLLGP